MNAVEVITFGCRLNAYESDVIRARAAEAGLTDAVVLNTCAVTAEAVRQARQTIRRVRRERPGARLIVTGCAAQIDPAAFAAMGEVDQVLGNAEKIAVGAYRTDGAPRVAVGDIFSVHEAAAPTIAHDAVRVRASVEIQNGCDHRCTFCVIPYGRGASRSVPAGLVVEAIRRLSTEGCREAVLTGVDLTSWGADLPGTPSLGALVRRILRLAPDLARLRLSSIDVAEIDDELLACFTEEPRLMPHLHLSLQSGDDMILKRMKRRHGRGQALTLIEAVRRVRPDTAFGADVIAGFPTETEAMFERTLSLVREARLAYLHVFPFSPRAGTPAARMPQVAKAAIKARAMRLREAGAAALGRHLESQVGRTVTGLVERPGRARAPDFTEILFDGDAPDGALLPITVTGHDGARAIGAPA
ncbi:MAG TPA: tRNA (N(6)-L-threonylcarbamoyladenosine(37)-C(2))-methylthiotransferase MtaB [Caulobacteraceae bacterium]|nr:tRNA (N(6)-L-threonylcarbamoyladenosine(37)-C(2))-methylthiotransferase MtaB [Caulobacteraceae bacterium]